MALIIIERLLIHSQNYYIEKFKKYEEDYENGPLIEELKGFKPMRPCLQILPQNWKPLIYTAVIMATKYWDDKYYWNVDVVNRLQMFDLQSMNKWENMFLEILQFNFYFSPKEFNSYFKWLIIYNKFIEKIRAKKEEKFHRDM